MHRPKDSEYDIGPFPDVCNTIKIKPAWRGPTGLCRTQNPQKGTHGFQCKQSQNIVHGTETTPPPQPNAYHSATLHSSLHIPPTAAATSLQPPSKHSPCTQPHPPRSVPSPSITACSEKKMTRNDIANITRGPNSEALLPAWRGPTGLCGVQHEEPITLDSSYRQPQISSRRQQVSPQSHSNTHHSSSIQPTISILPPPLRQQQPGYNPGAQPPPPRRPPPPNIPDPQEESMSPHNGGQPTPQLHLNAYHSSGISAKISIPEAALHQQPPRDDQWQQSSSPRGLLTPNIAEPVREKMSAENGCHDKNPAQQPKHWFFNVTEVDEDKSKRSKQVHLNRQNVDGDSTRRVESNNHIGSTKSLSRALYNGPPTEQQLSRSDVSHFVFIAFLERTEERKTMGVRVRKILDEGLEIDSETRYPDAKWTKETMVGEWNRYIEENKQDYKRIEKNDLIFIVNDKKDVDEHGLAVMLSELKLGRELRLVIRRSLNRRC